MRCIVNGVIPNSFQDLNSINIWIPEQAGDNFKYDNSVFKKT